MRWPAYLMLAYLAVGLQIGMAEYLRVGAARPDLVLLAVIFIAITSSFYSGLAARVPGLDASSAEVRKAIQPLNIPKTPPAGLDPQLVATAARDASTDAFHLSMLVSAGLLIGGGIVNAVGIRKEERPQDESGASPEAVAAA